VVKTEPGEDGAVGAALAWSQRHAKLSEELLRVQQAKHELEEVNRKLAAQVAGLQGESQSAQKELAEAHQMLLEMRRDLDQWKSNVLGFREEIRQAQQAQADALRKVLVLLGAEVPASAATQPATQPAFSTAQRSVSGDTANHK
jgi:chromosome segregation ATPase